jgi:2-succinyl-5-enolpyruvyl-6-hydroxy-3-cyclohexene-1-carboxylate synthase
MKASNPSTALATVLVDEFVRAGLTDACLAPGSRSAPLALALEADACVRLHVEIDERCAAFCALGLAKASGRPVVVVSTSGTAAANFHPAVIEAAESRVPLLVLTADRPPELRATGANQTIDQLKLYGDAVRWFAEVGVPEADEDAVAYWRSLAARAYGEAVGLAGRPGPVHLNVALREPLVPTGDGYPHELDGRDGGRAWTSTARAPRAPDDAVVDELAATIGAAERALLVLGDGIADAGPLLTLARVGDWPVLAEPLSNARSGSQAISTYAQLLAHPPFAATHRPDLVVRAGRVGLAKPLLSFLDRDVPQILFDGDGAWLDPSRALMRVVAGDPALVAGEVARRLPLRSSSPWLAAWREAEATARRVVDEVLDGEERPTEPRTARDLAAAIPTGGTLTVASSMPVRDLDAFARPRWGLRVFANRGASGIDGFISTAFGVALGSGGPAFALAGDLSMLHDASGFLLAERPPVVFVVVNNDGGGIFSFLPQAHVPAFERVFATPHGVDFGRLAAAYGCGHTHVQAAPDLVPAVEAARTAGGVQLVEVRTDRAENVAVHRRITAAVGDALGG